MRRTLAQNANTDVVLNDSDYLPEALALGIVLFRIIWLPTASSLSYFVAAEFSPRRIRWSTNTVCYRLSLSLHENGNIRISILPERQEILIGGGGFGSFALNR